MKAPLLLLCLVVSAPALASVNLNDAPLHHTLLSQTPDALKTELTFNDTIKLFGAGAATAVVTVPGSLLLGMALGGISNNLYVAAIPAVFSWILIPPIAITLVEWFYGRSMLSNSTRLFPGMLVGIGVNLAIVVASIILGVNARDLMHVIAVTGLSAVGLPAVITLFIKKPREQLLLETSWREQMQLQKQAFAKTGTLIEVPL